MIFKIFKNRCKLNIPITGNKASACQNWWGGSGVREAVKHQPHRSSPGLALGAL